MTILSTRIEPLIREVHYTVHVAIRCATFHPATASSISFQLLMMTLSTAFSCGRYSRTRPSSPHKRKTPSLRARDHELSSTIIHVNGYYLLQFI